MGTEAAIYRLADACGLQKSYTDQGGKRRTVSVESLLAALRAFGEPLGRPEDASDVLAARVERAASRLIEPVVVAWNGVLPELRLPRPADGRKRPARYEIRSECGGCAVWDRTERSGRGRRPRRSGSLSPLPIGRHRLIVERGPQRAEATVLSAPARCFRSGWLERSLGLFVPLYALRSGASWGTGDLSDLRAFASFAGTHGCRLVGTLPLLASYLDEPFEPSPYAPVSRLFWNELYLDPLLSPELAWSEKARRLLASGGHVGEVRALRAMDRVDYRRAAAAKRRALEALAESLHARRDRRRAEFDAWARRNPVADEYARFRAAVERQRSTWQDWPSRQRDGRLGKGDFDEQSRRYHLYVQWLWEEQFGGVAGRAAAAGAKLYLDLPIGVHRGGFDVWRYRSAFATGASVGAPPDMFFASGQNWGFPPPHPERQREDGYAYLAASLQNHMRHAGVLRIDHAAGLYRLYWIPQGLDATGGVYVTYPADEMFAVVSIESHRWRTTLVGENLGTVPPIVNRLMRRHGVYGMYVGQFEAKPGRTGPLPPPDRDVLACMNTHDTATFAGFYTGDEIDARERSGMLKGEEAVKERRARDRLRRAIRAAMGKRGGGTIAALEWLLRRLASSDAEMVLVTLEDLWGEIRPQNVPGTTENNWRQKATLDLEELLTSGRIVRLLSELGEERSRVGAAT